MLLFNWLASVRQRLSLSRYFRSSRQKTRPRVRPGRFSSVAAMVDMLEPRRLMSVVSAVDDSYMVQAEATPTPVTLDVLSNDFSDYGYGGSSGLTISSVGTVTHGSVTIQAADPNDPYGQATLSYTPDASYSGAETFTYTVSDGDGGQATATVTLALTGAGGSSGSGGEGYGYGYGYGYGTGEDSNASTGGAYSPGGSGSGTGGTGTGGTGTGTGTGGYGTGTGTTSANEPPLTPYLAYAEYHTVAIQPVVFVDYLGMIPVYQDQTNAANDVLGSFAELAAASASATEDLTENETVVTQVLDGTLTVVTVMTGTHTTTFDPTTGNASSQMVMTYDITTTFDDATGHDFVLHQWGDQTYYFQFTVSSGWGTSGTDTITSWNVYEERHDHYEFVMAPSFTAVIPDDTTDTTDNWTRATGGTIELVGNQSSTLTGALNVTTADDGTVLERYQTHGYGAHSDVADDIQLVVADRSADLNSTVTTMTTVDSFDQWTSKSHHESDELAGVRTRLVEEYHVIGDGVLTTTFHVTNAIDVTKTKTPSGTTGTATPVVTHTVITGFTDETSHDEYSFLAYGSVGTLASGAGAAAYSKYDDDAYGASTLDTSTNVTITQGTTVLTLTDDPLTTDKWTSNSHGYGSSVSVANPDWSGTAGWTKWSAPAGTGGTGSTGGTTTTPADPPEPAWLTKTGSASAQYDDTDDSTFDSTTTTGTSVLTDDGKGTVTKYTSDNKVHTFGDDHSVSTATNTETQTAVDDIGFSSTSTDTASGKTTVDTTGKTVRDVTNTPENSTLVSITLSSGFDQSADWSQSVSSSYGNSTTDPTTKVRVSWNDTTTSDSAIGSSTSSQSVGNVTQYDRTKAADDFEQSSSTDSTGFSFETPLWSSNGKDHSYSKTTSTPFDVDGDGKIANREYQIDYLFESDSEYGGTSVTTSKSSYSASGKTDSSVRGPDGSLTTYVANSQTWISSNNTGTSNSLGDSHLRSTDRLTAGGQAPTTGTGGGTNSPPLLNTKAKIETWSHGESHTTSKGFDSFGGSATTKYEVTDMTSQQAAVAPPPPNAPNPPATVASGGGGASNGSLFQSLFTNKKADELPAVLATMVNTKYGMLIETDDQHIGGSTSYGVSDVITDAAKDKSITTKIDAESVSSNSATYSTFAHQNVTENEVGSSTRKYRSSLTAFTTIDTVLSTEQDVVESAEGVVWGNAENKTHLVIVATPNPAAMPNPTGGGTTGGGTSGGTTPTTPPPSVYLYDIDGTIASLSDAFDVGKYHQSESSDSGVSNQTSGETSSSSYTNDGTHDVQEHSTFDATYTGGDSAATKHHQWSTAIEDGKYAMTAGDLFLTSSTTGSGTGATSSGNGNDYSQTGTLWTKAETDDMTETAADGSSMETSLYNYDTEQLFDYEFRVGATDTNYASGTFETTDLSLEETGDRTETTHSEDKFVIETPAPLTAVAKAAGVVAAHPTVTQASKSNWTLDEHSISKMNLTVHAANGTGSDSYVTDITFGYNNTSDTDGAYGDSSLDVAADGTKTTSESSWLQTKSKDVEGFALTVIGTFSDAYGSGTLNLNAGSGSVTKGVDTTAVAKGAKHHVRTDQSASTDTTGMLITYSSPDVKFVMGSSSGSGTLGEHRLDETFLEDGTRFGDEWHKSKGSGGASSSSSISINVDGIWYTSTTSASDASELQEAVGWREFGTGGYGSGGYGSGSDGEWQLGAYLRTNNGSTETTGQSPDGSSQKYNDAWNSTLSAVSNGSGGVELNEATSYGWTSSNTVPNPDPYGSGTVTTNDGNDNGLMNFQYQVSEGQALSLVLGPMVGANMAVPSYYHNFSSSAAAAANSAPSTTNGASQHATNASQQGAAAQQVNAPVPLWTPTHGAPIVPPSMFGGGSLTDTVSNGEWVGMQMGDRVNRRGDFVSIGLVQAEMTLTDHSSAGWDKWFEDNSQSGFTDTVHRIRLGDPRPSFEDGLYRPGSNGSPKLQELGGGHSKTPLPDISTEFRNRYRPDVSRMDSPNRGTGVFWTVDGRPYELSEQEIRDWEAITNRNAWNGFWSVLGKAFYTTEEEFKANIDREARGYRDMMKAVDGKTIAEIDPMARQLRRDARVRGAMQHKVLEVYETADNALFVVGVAKNGLKFLIPKSGSLGDDAVRQIAGEGDDAVRRHFGLEILDATCFVAGTPLLTPDGSKPIEQFKPGDAILSKSEHHPEGQVLERRVERVFQLTGLIAELRVGGRVIETTAEHPFYVPGQGWKRTCELEPGDCLVGHDGTLTPVEEVTLTGRTSAVYNLRVAEDHTYFVGDASWGFSIWAHNTYSARQLADGTWEVYDDISGTVRKFADDGRPFNEDTAKSAAKYWNPPSDDWVRPPGLRLPRDKGTWSGTPGNSVFTPDNPKAFGLEPGDVIPYREGRPDFSRWSKGNFTSTVPLTGHPDDMPKMIRTIAEKKGWTVSQTQEWLRQQRVTPHHAGGNEIQLIPWELHGNSRAIPPLPGIRHTGGAFDLRNP